MRELRLLGRATMRAKRGWVAQPETEHSLFWRLNSLFFEIFSLLISVGNYTNPLRC